MSATATKSSTRKSGQAKTKSQTKTSVNDTPDLDELEKNARETLKTVQEIRADENERIGKVANEAHTATSKVNEGLTDAEIEGKEEVEGLWNKTKANSKKVGKAMLYVAGGPVPRTRKEIVVAGAWYLAGAVTPVGEPARAAVRTVRGV